MHTGCMQTCKKGKILQARHSNTAYVVCCTLVMTVFDNEHEHLPLSKLVVQSMPMPATPDTSCCADWQEEEKISISSERGQHAHHHRLGGWEAFSVPTRGGHPTHDGESAGGSLQHGGLHGGKPAPAATWHPMAGPVCRHWWGLSHNFGFRNYPKPWFRV